MAEPQENPQEQKQQEKLDVYGAQGNQGQYGQGQYDSEGKPDLAGPQAQQIQTDLPKQPKNQSAKPSSQETKDSERKQ